MKSRSTFTTDPQTPSTIPSTPNAASYDLQDLPDNTGDVDINAYTQRNEIDAMKHDGEILMDVPGGCPDDVYSRQMSWWRAAIRGFLVRNLEYESRWIGWIQAKVHTPFLNKYFLYTSTLGTHMFFMTFLPILFFFGHFDIARGLLHIMCVGVYSTSFFKDLICSPRPFVPPVHRLTIGNHHLEYGFPSTHSANSVSFAIYLYYLLRNAASNSDSFFAQPTVYYSAATVLAWYATSIVFGRIYTGMHSFTDIFFGTLIGICIGLAQGVYGAEIEAAITTPSWMFPVGLIAVSILLVNQHPQPVDDCPCFEDAIAAWAVLMGGTIAQWHAAKLGLDVQSGFYQSRTPGWENITWNDTLLWWSFAFIKVVVGTCMVLIWRLAAKQILHATLPPLFRFASILITLPTRRFYTPATQYESVPVENRLHPIPSMMDLPSMLANADTRENGDEEVAVSGISPHAHLYSAEKGMKWRGSGNIGNGAKRVQFVPHEADENGKGEVSQDDEVDVKHYDADVITKCIVYGGIGVVATYILPVSFELLGWGVVPVN